MGRPDSMWLLFTFLTHGSTWCELYLQVTSVIDNLSPRISPLRNAFDMVDHSFLLLLHFRFLSNSQVTPYHLLCWLLILYSTCMCWSSHGSFLGSFWSLYVFFLCTYLFLDSKIYSYVLGISQCMSSSQPSPPRPRWGHKHFTCHPYS